MNKYRDIQTLDQLNKAIHQNKEAVALRGKQLRRSFDKARGFYTPGKLLGEGARKLVSRFRLTDIASALLWVLRRR